MCGIAGIYNQKEPVKEEQLNRMSRAIIHRGPDDSGIYVGDNIGLCHRRLSIIDTSKLGAQPMCRDGRYWIVFNGEIYNYLELRNELKADGEEFNSESDTEVILAMYSKYGVKALSKLRGMFSFAIFDNETKELFCARDRLGIKPFYYFKSDGRFLFASEVKALLTSQDVPRKVNNKMLFDFLAYSRTDHTDETCFLNIFNLRPGHFLTVGKNGLKIEKWYSIPNLKESTEDFDTIKEIFKGQLKNSVNLHLRSDVPVGSCLSGGIDSSSIVLLENKLMTKNQELHTFSAIYDQNWEKDERKYIQDVVKTTKAKPYYCTPTPDKLTADIKKLIYHQEEPFSDPSIFASWCVMELAKNHNTKVLLDGQGADEILGYDYMSSYYFFELIKKGRLIKFVKEIIPFIRKQRYGVLFSIQLLTFLFLPKSVQLVIVKATHPYISKSFFDKCSQKSTYFNSFFNCSSLNDSVQKHLVHKLCHLLRFEDKNSMAFSVETRVPFLDHLLVELALTIPAEMKIKSGKLKYVLSEAMKPELPRSIYDRTNKIGFETPRSEWFKNPKLRDLIIQTIKKSIHNKREFLDLPNIEKTLGDFIANKILWDEGLWKVMIVELWFEVFDIKNP